MHAIKRGGRISVHYLYEFYVQSLVQLNLGVIEIVGNVTSVCRGRLRVEQAARR